MILLVDNYDSFTYNLYQQVSGLGAIVEVIKNDEYSLDQIKVMKPEKLILSPGPKTPAHSGICLSLIRSFYESIPILGICLGHQCLAAAFGKSVRPASQLVFGKTTRVKREADTPESIIMSGVPETFEAARYHSLVISNVPHEFFATSHDDHGDIMSMEHKDLPLFGLQFHPESFLMGDIGNRFINNFLAI